LTTVARLGQAHWFFGNLYEGAVGMPQLLADAQRQRPPRLLGPGSPIRYYAPVAPLTVVTTTAVLVDGWRSGGNRRMITTAATGMASALGLSAYLIRTVNLRLLRTGEPLSAADRRRLVTRWHRVNMIRLVALAVAAAALRG
jgi:Domain of unknown function (DUF1772)